MRLLVGAITYLTFIGALIYGGWMTVTRFQPSAEAATTPPETYGARTEQPAASEPSTPDPQRRPIWIAATPKYNYTPPAPQRPNSRPVITVTRPEPQKKKTRTAAKPAEGLRAIQRALGQPEMSGQSLGYASSRRDNDPLFRD